jgi:hypothetical protein
MKRAIILFAFLMSECGFAQTKDSVTLDDDVFREVLEEDKQGDEDWAYNVIEEMPEFPGGHDALIKNT